MLLGSVGLGGTAYGMVLGWFWYCFGIFGMVLVWYWYGFGKFGKAAVRLWYGFGMLLLNLVRL